MQIVKIDGKEYRVISDWSEMTIDKADQLYQIIDEMPEALKTIYDHMVTNRKKELEEALNDISDEDRIKNFPLFYGRIIEALGNVPSDTVNKILTADRTVYYQMYMERFVIGLLHHPYDFNPKGIESFKFEGETYYLPGSMSKLGEHQPMAESETIEFVECADLELNAKRVESGRFRFAANVVSILCRPKGEKYDEQTSLKRAGKFRSLDMGVFWEVFFSLVQYRTKFVKDIRSYLMRSESKERQKYPLVE